jgi:hypothetical protein
MLFPRRALDLDLRFQLNLQCGECVSTSSLDCCFWRERIARLTSPKHTLPHRSRAAAPSAGNSSARRSAGWPCPAGPLPQCNGTLLRRGWRRRRSTRPAPPAHPAPAARPHASESDPPPPPSRPAPPSSQVSVVNSQTVSAKTSPTSSGPLATPGVTGWRICFCEETKQQFLRAMKHRSRPTVTDCPSQTVRVGRTDGSGGRPAVDRSRPDSNLNARVALTARSKSCVYSEFPNGVGKDQPHILWISNVHFKSFAGLLVAVPGRRLQ